MSRISLILAWVPRGMRLLCAVSIASSLHAPIVLAQAKSNNPVVQSDASSAFVSVQKRYPGGTIQSVEAADRALADVEKERAAIEAQFAAEQRACYEKFFANSCVDEAKERRRIALAKIRPVEIEANTFKRRVRVIERDKALAEKHAEDERKSLQRAQEEQVNLADPPKAPKAAVNERASVADEKYVSPTIDDRVRQHEERLKRLEAEDQANAQKRAENVAAYEERVRKAEERQRRVAEKKKQKELEKAKKSTPPKP